MKTNLIQSIANKIAELVRPSEIAAALRISPPEMESLLAKAVVLGCIRRSDILFTFPQPIRDDVEVYHVDKGISPDKLYNYFTGLAMDVDECETNFLCAFIRQRVVYSDLYQMLSDIEATLHKRIRQCLKEAFRDSWWREGVSSTVRKACVAKREEDTNPADDPYTYTPLIELKTIIEGTNSKPNWKIFATRLPKGAQDKKQFLANLDKLNPIRNRVMHPVRLGERLEETEYRFVSQMHNTLVTSLWNVKQT